MLTLLPKELFFGSDDPETRPEFLMTRFPKETELHISPSRAISRALGVENELKSPIWPGIDLKYLSVSEFSVIKRARENSLAYLYVFDKKDIFEYNPSPFSIGKVVYLISSGKGVVSSSAGVVEFMGWIGPMAKSVISEKEMNRVIRGDIESWKNLGWKLLPKLTLFQKKSVVLFSGGSILVSHDIPVQRVYVFDKIKDNGLFLKDGSNYSQVAKLIWERND